jgi:ABC-type transporter Mla MlaB component
MISALGASGSTDDAGSSMLVRLRAGCARMQKNLISEAEVSKVQSCFDKLVSVVVSRVPGMETVFQETSAFVQTVILPNSLHRESLRALLDKLREVSSCHWPSSPKESLDEFKAQSLSGDCESTFLLRALGLHDAVRKAKATSLDLAHLKLEDSGAVCLEAENSQEGIETETETISMSAVLGLVDALSGVNTISEVIACAKGSLQHILNDLANHCPLKLLHLPPKAVAGDLSRAKLVETMVNNSEFRKGGFLDTAKILGQQNSDARLACEGLVDLMTRLTERFSTEEEFSIEDLGIAAKDTKVTATELALLCKLLSQVHCTAAMVSYIGTAYLTAPGTVIQNAAIRSDVKSACIKLDKAISALQSTLDIEELHQALVKDEFKLKAADFASWAQRARDTSSALKAEIFTLLVSLVAKISEEVANKIPKTDHIVNDVIYNQSRCKENVIDAVDSHALSGSTASLYTALQAGAKDFAEMHVGTSVMFEDTYVAIRKCNEIFEEAQAFVRLYAHLKVIQELTEHTVPTQALG